MIETNFPNGQKDGNYLSTLVNDRDKLSEWSERLQLPFNNGKYKSMHIGKKNKHRIYEMNGQMKLDEVKGENDLGVLTDDELKFHKQTTSVIRTTDFVYWVLLKSHSLSLTI